MMKRIVELMANIRKVKGGTSNSQVGPPKEPADVSTFSKIGHGHVSG